MPYALTQHTNISCLAPCLSKFLWKYVLDYFICYFWQCFIICTTNWASMFLFLMCFSIKKIETLADAMCLPGTNPNWSGCKILLKCGVTFLFKALKRILYIVSNDEMGQTLLGSAWSASLFGMKIMFLSLRLLKGNLSISIEYSKLKSFVVNFGKISNNNWNSANHKVETIYSCVCEIPEVEDEFQLWEQGILTNHHDMLRPARK